MNMDVAPALALSAAHWAATDAPLVEGVPPCGAAAGGAKRTPAISSASEDWEWEITAIVRPSASATTGSRCPPAQTDEVAHRGGCHCGAVRFEAKAPSKIIAYDCICSSCRMRRNLHFVVPADHLKLIRDERGGDGGAGALAEYRFGTGTARHLFCARCGITPFYRARSNPSGWAVTFQCLDAGTVSSVEVRHFDGVHWEECYASSGIASFSESREESSEA